MAEKHEILFLMGCFDFEYVQKCYQYPHFNSMQFNIFIRNSYFFGSWSEIDVVRQIIMKHSSYIGHAETNKVFTIGIGMFTTFFQNLNNDDGRRLTLTKNTKVIEFAKKCNGGFWRDRFLEIYDFSA